MSNEKYFFDNQISSLHSLTSIYQYLHDNANFMNADALLRSEYVLIVSSFDNYLHNIVRQKIRDSFFSAQAMPKNFNLPIEICQLIRTETSEDDQKSILDAALRSHLEKDSFQSPKGVEYALNLININHIWKASSAIMGKPPEYIRNQLALIVKRRNQIAHEADIDCSTGMPRSIDVQTITDCRSFLEKLVMCIDAQI